MAVQEAKTENSSNDSLFADENPKANNRNNPALEKKWTAQDIATKTFDGQGCQNKTVSLVC